MKLFLIPSFLVMPFFLIAQDCIDESAVNPDCFCFELYDPVCGCDGEIYSNLCYATECSGVTFYIPAQDAGGNFIDCAAAFDNNVNLEGQYYVMTPESISYFEFTSNELIIYEFSDSELECYEVSEFEYFANDSILYLVDNEEGEQLIFPYEFDESIYIIDGITTSELMPTSFDASIWEECQDCLIEIYTLEAEQCDSNGMFMVTIDIQFENPNAATFTVFGNGTNYGNFEYGQDTYSIGPLLADGETDYEFVVQDNENSECQDFYELGYIDCEDFFDCNIYDVTVEAEECDSNGYFMAILDFEIENPNAATFTVFGNGTNYGNFEYGQDTYSIGPLLADGETDYEFVVQDNENSECQDFYELGTVECDTPSSLMTYYSSPKSLLYIKNILGETILYPRFNVPYIYFYSDGSYEKKVIFVPR